MTDDWRPTTVLRRSPHIIFALSAANQPVTLQLALTRALQQIRAARPPVAASYQVHQPPLAGAGPSHARAVLAALDLQRYAAQGVNFFFAHHLALPQIDGLNQR